MANTYSGSKSLISSTTRVEVPYVKVTIGEFTFGVYANKTAKQSNMEFYSPMDVQYPNYIQSLNIEKINGQVNTYTLEIIYTITPSDDPNFFEYVFSSVADTRKIIFSYGDLSAPQYIYKNEQAIITDVKTRFDQQAAKITYTVSAVSAAVLSQSSAKFYPARNNIKPSDIIWEQLKDPDTGLLDLFTGMNNINQVKLLGLIAGDDKQINIPAKDNVTPLEYIKYLVSIMTPAGTASNVNQVGAFYALTIHDEAENESLVGNFQARDLGGPYFKVQKVDKNVDHSDAYEVDIGYPSANIITNFQIDNNENYSIFYKYQNKKTSNEYIYRLDEDGAWIREYSPALSSANKWYRTTEEDKVWWTKLTEYPVSGTLTIRGLLRPALLMEYVRINVYYFGRKHISSGVYIITKQVDNISSSGYKTTLNLTRVSGDEEGYN